MEISHSLVLHNRSWRSLSSRKLFMLLSSLVYGFYDFLGMEMKSVKLLSLAFSPKIRYKECFCNVQDFSSFFYCISSIILDNNGHLLKERMWRKTMRRIEKSSSDQSICQIACLNLSQHQTHILWGSSIFVKMASNFLHLFIISKAFHPKSKLFSYRRYYCWCFCCSLMTVKSENFNKNLSRLENSGGWKSKEDETILCCLECWML